MLYQQARVGGAVWPLAAVRLAHLQSARPAEQEASQNLRIVTVGCNLGGVVSINAPSVWQLSKGGFVKVGVGPIIHTSKELILFKVGACGIALTPVGIYLIHGAGVKFFTTDGKENNTLLNKIETVMALKKNALSQAVMAATARFGDL